MNKIKYLHFCIGGYFSDSKTLNYSGGYFVYNITEQWGEDKQCIPHLVDENEIMQLSSDLEQLGVFKWKKEYNSMAFDGTQWELKIHFNGNLKKHIYGSNAYPNPKTKDDTGYSPDFKKFLKILNSFMKKPGFF